MSAPHILVVDDEPDIRRLMREILEDEGYVVSMAENGATAREARRTQRPDLVLLDIWMPDIDGISLLKEWAPEGKPEPPVIMISGHGTVETAVEATRYGAYDYLEKPLSLAKLLITVKHALEADRLRRENVGLRKTTLPLIEPIGRSPVMRELRDQIERIAQSEAWVLLTGEAGSGKELFARYLHSRSARADGPFVDMMVASIARENAAIELFGNEDGDRVRYGLLEQANGGILFLSEVGDMDAGLQAKLHAALQNRSFLRIGGREPVTFDVRIVSASHRDLEQGIRSGRFREDLFYQLNVVPVKIPPLRHHGEDVTDLLNYYVNYFAMHERLPYREFSVAAQNRLRHYGWPGNVRELKNLVQRLLILGSGDEIGVDEVDIALGTGVVQPQPAESDFDLPLRDARERFERAYLEHQLRVTGGSVGQVAKLAGMERTHLYRKLRALGINPKGEWQEK